MMSVTLSKSASTQSMTEDSPTKETSKKKERNALSQKFTKISLFGRKLRGKETNSTTLTKDQLQDYLNSQTNHEWDDTSSMSEEEGALILWEEDGNVKAATPAMLVRRITDEKFVDSNLLLDVIVSYRSFATPAQFMDLLIQRFEVSSPISLRVCAVLKTWIERQWGDFDSVLADTLVSFVRGTVRERDILKNVAEQLLKLVEKKRTPVTDDGNNNNNNNNNNNKRAASLSNPPKPLLPLTASDIDIDNIADDDPTGTLTFGPSVTVWSFPGKELARQLTLLEQKLYLWIEPRHLIDQAWAKHPDLSPPVVTLINHFNKVSGWAYTEIVRTADLQQRIERVLQMIEVAQNFFLLNNFNGLMAVLAGLHSSSVHRLKRTWAAVPEKSKSTFEFLTAFMSSAKNYSQYREYALKAQLPVLPYLGVSLTDLTFIEDGNPAEIGHLVNFSKCRQIAAVIRKMQEFQSVHYDLIPIPFVQNYFNTFAVIDEKAAYESSTRIEPRALSTQVSASQMSAAVASVASSSFASLTSSMGIDKEYDLGDTSELVEGEFVIDTMHTRFKKDLIRSRNNSLNIGEPFPAKVQLPGSLPVEMRMPANTTAKQAVKHFANFFSGLNEQYCLVVMPCKQDPKGYVFTNEELVKEVLRNRETNQTTTKLALFASPLMVSSAVFSGSSLGDCRDILVDLGVPLFSMFSLFQETFFGATEEITFLAYDKEAKQAWWMNTHKSLEANHFSKSCLLIVYPISNLLHASADSMAGGDKQGMLVSGGREGTLKVATVKTVTAILSGPFLLCYKNKHDAAPTDVIALDRYTVQCSSAKHVSVLLEKNPIFPAPVISSNKSHYSFAADMDSETRAWLRALQRNRGVLGDKVVFGEDLNKTAKQHIPVVLQKTVNFINSHALQVEGLFKPHTNSSLVQHYKNQFDSGVDVEFTRTNDAGTVAQLLLMFFEELPDPLLSYELFHKFVEFAQKPPPIDEEANALRDIVSNLSYPHKTVLAYLLAFLSQVSTENPIKNGIVNIFGPWLLRAPPNESEPKGFKEIARSVTGKLIKHREKIFIGLSRRPEASAQEEDPKVPASSNMPKNTNPQCTEAALLIDKQLQNNAAIAKKVELLKSQLENKYTDNKNKYENKYSNKYKKPTQLKRQVSFHDDLQQNKTQLQTTRSSPAYHRTAKSVSYVTTTTYDPAAGPHKDHEVAVPIHHLLGHDVQVVDSSPSEGSDISLHTDPTDFTDRSSSDPSDPPDPSDPSDQE